MSARSFRRAKARRALTDGQPVATSDTTSHSILTHGLAALAISVLGLGVAGSVSLTSTAQSNQVDERASLTASVPDTSRAEPAPRAAELTAVHQAAAQENERQSSTQEDQSDDGGTLDSFSSRDDRESRSSVRVELDRAIAAKEVAERDSELSRVDEEVVTTSRKVIQSERAEELQTTGEEIEAEDERIKEEERRKAEEKRKAEEAARAAAEEERRLEAEAAAGTLSTAGAQPAPADTSAEYQVEAVEGDGGGASPIASGSYSIAARWGAVGSWSRYHTGVDLSAPIGTPIRAAADGVVVGPASGAGWAGTHVVIKHSDGSHTLYAHMASTAVSPGQQVKGGTVIGVVGMTGRTFGPHCHFEWYPPGTSPGDVYSSKDPYVWMLSQGVRL